MGEHLDRPNHKGRTWLDFWIFYNKMAPKKQHSGQTSELISELWRII